MCVLSVNATSACVSARVWGGGARDINKMHKPISTYYVILITVSWLSIGYIRHVDLVFI